MTKVKICGLKKIEHAIIAAESGADFLGFVFVEGVRRAISPKLATEIIIEFRKIHKRASPKLIGLFSNQEASFVNQVIKSCGLDIVQLCGQEDPSYWPTINCSIIKQIKVGGPVGIDSNKKIADEVNLVATAGHIALLDSYEPGKHGGTGHSFDWSIATSIANTNDFILAGGLNDGNINEAINTVRPWAVDVSTGVETDGDKDDAKIMNFIESVRTADKQIKKSK